MSTLVDTFLSHKAQSDAIEAQRAELEEQRRAAEQVEDWDTSDALTVEIEKLSDQNMELVQAMAALPAQMNADDKAAIKKAVRR